MTRDELEIAEKSILRTLSHDELTSYGERQRLSLIFIRLVLERSLRETERKLGLRHPRA
jgi:hypothetical protein